MSVPRWIVVDDTDPSIVYTGPWFADASGSQDNSDTFGPTYRSTLHGATLNASLSYNFSGTQVVVLGSNNLRNDSGVLDPTWECFIDNISIGASTPFQFPENNWVFCSQNTLVDGPHTLTVNVTVRESQTFWLDDIQYVPSASVPLDGQAILVDNLDPVVQSGFDSDWHSLGSTANETQTTNSAFNFEFTGVSLSWYGFIPTEFAHNATTGTYSVDQNTPTSFPLNGLPASAATEYNQKFFQTPNFTQGKHQIVVLFEGNGQTTPLTLDYLIVQNGTSPAAGTGGSTSNTNPSSTTGGTNSPSAGGTSGNSGRKSNAGIIAGSVVGGLVLIALTIFAVFWIRRREKKTRQEEKNMNISSTLQPEPFVYSPVPVMNPLQQPGGYNTNTQPDPRAQFVPVRGGNVKYSGGHNQLPSVSIMVVSQSIEPPSTAPTSAASFSTNANTAGHEQQPLVLGLIAQPSHTFPTRSEKLQREAEATSATLRTHVRTRDGALSSPTAPSSESTSPPRVMMHQDSGLRLHGVPASEVVQEIPPEYTAG